MKKYLLAAILLLGTLGTAAAQTRPRYVFDNFSSGGIQVEPKPAPRAKVLPEKRPGKNLVKRTAQTAPVLEAQPFLTSADAKTSLRRFSPGANTTLRGFSTGDFEIDGFIVDSCARHGVDPLLIFAQMNQESSFKLRATSNKGARGLMQLMPATAVRFGVSDIYDPQQNIEGGVKYMRWLLDTFNGDVSLALAGYNAGENAVMRYGWAIPPYNETQDYVRRINARYESLRGGSLPVPAVRPVAQALPAARPVPFPVTTFEVKKSGSINIDERAVVAVRNRDGKAQMLSQ